MRVWHRLVGIIGAGLVLGVAAACARPLPAHAAGAWIEVTPSPVAAGSTVRLRADCLDNTVPARVISTVFGTVTVRPVERLLVADVRVPSKTREGTYEVRLSCRNGSTAVTSLLVLSASDQPMDSGPNTGGGFLATDGAGGTSGGGAGAWLWAAAAALTLGAGIAVGSRRRARPPARVPARRSTRPGRQPPP